MSPYDLAAHDVVLVTYETLAIELNYARSHDGNDCVLKMYACPLINLYIHVHVIWFICVFSTVCVHGCLSLLPTSNIHVVSVLCTCTFMIS